MEEIEHLQKIIDASTNIVFFGGAGVSTESGIKDFRGKDGLYKEKNKKTTEYYLSARCFYKKPAEFFTFYKKNMNCLDKSPNCTHIYLTNLEKRGTLKAIITQNIDGLHKKAKSQNVLEIHGTIYENFCTQCQKEYSASYVFEQEGIPKCVCGGIIKPNVVLYGEMLNDSYLKAVNYIGHADTLLVAGTSLTVEPAAGLLKLFTGKNLVIINREKTPYDAYATLVIHKELKDVFAKLV